MTGSFGAMGCFSFYANKIITTGEGGMVLTDDDELAERLRLLRNLAFQQPRFFHEHAGHNFRMTGYQAAMGRVAAREDRRHPRREAARRADVRPAARRRRRASAPRSSRTGRGTSTGCTRSWSRTGSADRRDELVDVARATRASSRARSSAR